MSDLFISYSRDDGKDFVDRLRSMLRENGRSAWVDDYETIDGHRYIPIGDKFWEKIEKGINSANTFVFIITPTSILKAEGIREYCRLEIEHAIAQKKRIIPIAWRDSFILDPNERIEDRLNGEISTHKELKDRNFLVFSNQDFQFNFEQLIQAIEIDSDYVEMHTRFLIEAQNWQSEGRKDSDLLGGNSLEKAEIWLSIGKERAISQKTQESRRYHDPEPTETHERFIKESRLAENARLKREYLIRLGTGAFILSLIAAAIAAGFALYFGDQARLSSFKAEQGEKTLKSAQDEKRIVEREKDILSIEVKEKQNQVEQARKNLKIAQQKQQKAEGEAKQADDEAKTAQQRSKEAQEKQYIAEKDAQNADKEKTKAINSAKIAQMATIEAKQSEQQALITRNNAIKEQEKAQIGTRLERDGIAAIEKFNIDQTEGLLSSLRAVGELKKFDIANKSIDDLPAASPLLALQIALDNLQEQRIMIPDGALWDIKYSPDSKTIAMAGGNGSLWLLDSNTNRSTRINAHEGRVKHIQFSFDGETIATSGFDGKIYLWDIHGNKKLELISLRDEEYYSRIKSGKNQIVGELNRHENPLIFSYNNKLIAYLDIKGSVQIWNISNNQKENSNIINNLAEILTIRFSPDNKFLVAGGKSGKLFFLNLDTYEKQLINTKQGDIQSIAFSSDGKKVATGGTDGSVKILELNSMKSILLSGLNSNIISLEFSPDNMKIAAGSKNSKAMLWDIGKNKAWPLQGHESEVSFLKFSLDGQKLATASQVENILRIWSLEGVQTNKFIMHTDQILAMAFNPNSEEVATVARGGLMTKWKLSYDDIDTFNDTPKDDPVLVKFSPNKRDVAIFNKRNGSISLWNPENRKKSNLNNLNNFSSMFSFNNNGSEIAIGSVNGPVRIWSRDLNNWQSINEIYGYTQAIQFSPDGNYIVASLSSGDLMIWNRLTRQSIKLNSRSFGIISIQFVPNSDIFVTAAVSGEIRFWNLNGEEVSRSIDNLKPIGAMDISPDGKLVVIGDQDGSITMWERSTGQKKATLKIHTGGISSIQLSQDGSMGITYSLSENLTKIWDRKGRVVAQYPGKGDASNDWKKIVLSVDNYYLQKKSISARLLLPTNINDLFDVGCDRIKYYLLQSPELKDDRKMCGFE